MTTLHSHTVINAALAGGFGTKLAPGRDRPAGFFARVGAWFRRDRVAERSYAHGDVASDALDPSVDDLLPAGADAIDPLHPRPRLTLAKWARRPAPRRRLDDSIDSLADAMRGVRDQLEQQSARQEELLRRLLLLPEVLEGLPESQRAQVETLRAMGQRVERQTARQDQIAAVLERIARADADRGETMEAVRAGIEGLGRRDEAFAGAVDAIGRGSEAGARAAERLREDLVARDRQWERVLERHNARFTGLIAIATTLSVAALTAVVVTGYVMLARVHP